MEWRKRLRLKNGKQLILFDNNIEERGIEMNSIFHRTSIRKYTQQKVEQEKITEILKAAMAAPSAGNQQLAATSPYAGCTAKAPIAFVACFRKNCPMPEYAQIDVSASIENMLLMIDKLELGAVWLGIAPLQERMDAVRKVLDIPEELEAFAIIPCGYPAEEKNQQDRFEQIRVHYVDK